MALAPASPRSWHTTCGCIQSCQGQRACAKAPEEATAADGDGEGIIVVGPPRDGAAAAAALAGIGMRAIGTRSCRAPAPKSYVCMECGKGFGHAAGLLAHQRAQHGDRLGVAGGEEPAHICVECGEGFVQCAALGRHKKIQVVGASSVCNSCGQSFCRAGGEDDGENQAAGAQCVECRGRESR